MPSASQKREQLRVGQDWLIRRKLLLALVTAIPVLLSTCSLAESVLARPESVLSVDWRVVVCASLMATVGCYVASRALAPLVRARHRTATPREDGIRGRSDTASLPRPTA